MQTFSTNLLYAGEKHMLGGALERVVVKKDWGLNAFLITY